MTLRLIIRLASQPREILLILSCADTARAAGKFILGRAREDARQLAAAFDDACAFHKDIAEKHGIRPLGGGWCELDHERRIVTLSGRSTQFGREPDRGLVIALFQQAFPAYSCWHED
jgi:hypothetical protein